MLLEKAKRIDLSITNEYDDLDNKFDLLVKLHLYVLKSVILLRK